MAMLGESIDPRLLRLDPQVFKSIESAGAAYGDMYANLGESAGITIEKIQQNQRNKEDFVALEASTAALAKMLDQPMDLWIPIIENYRHDAKGGQQFVNSVILQNQLGDQKIEQIEETGYNARWLSREIGERTADQNEETRLWSAGQRDEDRTATAAEANLHRKHDAEESRRGRALTDAESTKYIKANISAAELKNIQESMQKGLDRTFSLEEVYARIKANAFEGKAARDLRRYSLQLELDFKETFAQGRHVEEKDRIALITRLKGESEENLVNLTHALALKEYDYISKKKIEDARNLAFQADAISTVLRERHLDLYIDIMGRARDLKIGTKPLFAMTTEELEKEQRITLELKDAGFMPVDFRSIVSSSDEMEERIKFGTWSTEQILPDFFNMVPVSKRKFLEGPEGARIYGNYMMAVNNLLKPTPKKKWFGKELKTGEDKVYTIEERIKYNKDMLESIEAKLALTAGAGLQLRRQLSLMQRRTLGLFNAGDFILGAANAYDMRAREQEIYYRVPGQPDERIDPLDQEPPPGSPEPPPERIIEGDPEDDRGIFNKWAGVMFPGGSKFPVNKTGKAWD